MYSMCGLLLLFVTGSYAALPLPSYIKPCGKLDPNFEECMLQRAREVLPRIVQGDRKYGLPPLDPVEVTELRTGSSGISMDFKDIKLFGLKDADLKIVKYDLENKETLIHMLIPLMEIRGNYNMSGRVLLLPIIGNGLFNFKLVNAHAIFGADFKFEEREGKTFMKFYNPRMELTPTRASYDLTNLFNGDKLLGGEMLNLLNTEWKDAYKELSPPIIEGANQVVLSIIDSFMKRLPFDVVFPDHA